tara:strand:- start:448 stop:564 length:117 start_codon:yes stop_codon:yes gene_type:complete
LILDLGIAVVKRYVYVELGFKKPLVVFVVLPGRRRMLA